MANASIRTLLSLIHKRCLQTSATLAKPTKESSFTVQFLVNSCGLPLESAISTSAKFQLDEKNKENHLSVIDFFKAHGFNQTQIAKLIEKRPGILQCKVEDNLKPKFDFLIENGFVGKLLPELVVASPEVYRRAVDSHIKPSLNILKSFLDSNEKIVMAVKRSSWLLNFNLKGIMLPNIDLLIQEGVPVNAIAKLIMSQPRALMQAPHRMVYAVNAVKNVGIEPASPMFVHAVRVMVSMSESTLKKKIEVMQSFGWSKEEIFSAFKKDPLCLACSEYKLRTSMNFYVNTLKLDPHIVISYPKFLMFGIEKRLHPRYNVLKILQSEKLIEEGKRIEWLLAISNEKFLKNYVIKYVDQVPRLLEIFNGINKPAKIDN